MCNSSKGSDVAMIVFEGCFALVIFPASQAPHKMILLELDTLDAYDMLLLDECV